jgi:hypothetical protein
MCVEHAQPYSQAGHPPIQWPEVKIKIGQMRFKMANLTNALVQQVAARRGICKS